MFTNDPEDHTSPRLKAKLRMKDLIRRARVRVLQRCAAEELATQLVLEELTKMEQEAEDM